MTREENLLKIEGQNDIFELKKVKIFRKYQMFENIIIITNEKGEKELCNY